jgi:hypothetical protein
MSTTFPSTIPLFVCALIFGLIPPAKKKYWFKVLFALQFWRYKNSLNYLNCNHCDQFIPYYTLKVYIWVEPISQNFKCSEKYWALGGNRGQSKAKTSSLFRRQFVHN